MRKFLFLSLVLAVSSVSSAAPTIDPKRTVLIDDAIMFDNSSGVLGALAALTNDTDNTDPVTLVINSPGGSIFVGNMIINAMYQLQEQGVKINCLVTNFAMSMAMQIYLHCDNRYALPAASFLWHRARVILPQNATVTAPLAAKLAEGLQREDTQALKDLKFFMYTMDPTVLEYHFEAESVVAAADLDRLTKGEFISIVRSLPGLSTVLGPKASRNVPSLSAASGRSSKRDAQDRKITEKDVLVN